MDTIEKNAVVDEGQLPDNTVVQSSPEKGATTITDASIEDVEKSYYSKQSVWLMVLFSGLAIGSDG